MGKLTLIWRPPPGRGVAVNCSAVGRGDGLHDRQAESRAFALVGAAMSIRWNGWRIRAISSLVISGPVLATAMRAPSEVVPVKTSMSPPSRL